MMSDHDLVEALPDGEEEDVSEKEEKDARDEVGVSNYLKEKDERSCQTGRCKERAKNLTGRLVPELSKIR